MVWRCGCATKSSGGACGYVTEGRPAWAAAGMGAGDRHGAETSDRQRRRQTTVRSSSGGAAMRRALAPKPAASSIAPPRFGIRAAPDAPRQERGRKEEGASRSMATAGRAPIRTGGTPSRARAVAESQPRGRGVGSTTARLHVDEPLGSRNAARPRSSETRSTSPAVWARPRGTIRIYR